MPFVILPGALEIITPCRSRLWARISLKQHSPPLLLYAIDETTVARTCQIMNDIMKGSMGMVRQFELGDRVTSETKFLDEEHDQRADVTRQRGEILFRSADKGLVARAIVTTVETEYRLAN